MSRLLAAVAVAAVAGGCAATPISSLPTLTRIDFATTRFDALVAGVVVPAAVVPDPGGVTLSIRAEGSGGWTAGQEVRLVPVPPPARFSWLGAAGERRVHAFGLRPADAERLDRVRDEVLARRTAGERGSVEISVGVRKVCRDGPLGDGPIPVDTWLATSETGGAVPLARGIDLASLPGMPTRPADALPPCDRQVGTR